jgi:hypothetical protein
VTYGGAVGQVGAMRATRGSRRYALRSSTMTDDVVRGRYHDHPRRT